LIMIGGTVDPDSFNTISIESMKTIQALTVDKTFTGACSISPEWGLSTTTLDEAVVKRAMMEAAKEVYILAESSKFGHRSLANVGPLKPQYHLITDKKTTGIQPLLQQLVSQGMQIITADFE